MAYLEFLVIGILAFLIIGPKDLPKALFYILKMIQKLRNFLDHQVQFSYSDGDLEIPLHPVNHSFEDIEETSFFSQRQFYKIESCDQKSMQSICVLSIANQDRF
jgi:Sec-independent protein translocase protein TatA